LYSSDYGENIGAQKKSTLHHIVHKIAYDLVIREILYNILTDHRVSLQIHRFIKLSSNETCIKDRIGKYLSDALPVQNGLKDGP
jgi:hypothetical protein